ncbi:hypothetical protein HW115_04270 [Verrucomicrobiaceae bacterium N1E253]|uniref:Uncharacterized protein n=1 Tax=Oceaniferula marina TaxID=2748318 RepID=A0A851GJG0_9BACT|nr:hypothetical protein [Oceaniferula marina]NWK54810.1 hypothetical protein [Oceaniferula marina]
MFLTILNAVCLIILGLAGFFKWESLNASGTPTEMLMPVFFGGALLICAGFTRVHYRHGLYGGLIIALLGVCSAIYRIYQYGGISSLSEAKPRLIAAMGALCILQLIAAWKAVQDDREIAPPI